MSDIDSRFLENTRKDLVGEITAVVVLSVLLHASVADTPLDSKLEAFLSEKSKEINRFSRAILSAACAEELTDELDGTLSELIPAQRGYYDRLTINALLSLYADEPRLTDFCAMDEPTFRAACIKCLLRKLTEISNTTLWCRVNAYERDSKTSSLNLSIIHATCLELVPLGFREQLGSSEVWAIEAKDHWRNSSATQMGLELTAGTRSGLTKVLSEL